MSKATQLETWTRVGFFARGLIYILLGYVAISAAAPDSTSDLFKSVEDLPGGTIMLAIITLGAIGYGLWKILDAVQNLEGFDDDAKGKAKRFFYVVGGVGYFVLAYLAGKTLLGSGGSGQGTEQAAAASPDILLYLVGAGIGIAGLYQIKKGVTREFLNGLKDAPPLVEYWGMLGHVARGIVFIVSGWAVIQATGNSGAAKGLAGALASLKGMGTIFTILCIGLILFGLFSLVEAKYRTVPNEDLRPGH
ncbi:DUF1206 domain-containing protein [Sphingomicrobium clamense]|uniref:DUF1206 domain-containing protein n=1 Tax=Sphingomicrobium clamense TaxID=2851013 RepID=A0ABS6V2Z3_9SPHN|nr:DUF1206 domain-containing protein [Sphingomicrobium sp. B8]MBW0143735.1 DUF1206 domain-containing protein [Sphingomicrobium sp. B8]